MSELFTMGILGCLLIGFLMHMKGMLNLLSKEVRLVQELLERKIERCEDKCMKEIERRVPNSQYPLKFEKCDIELKHLPLPIAHKEFEFTDKIINESKVEDFTFPVNRFGDIKEDK